ncbi:hypothetical protein B0H66DRAFT_486444 [Apodospora peruviana]|uniref:RBR-type E3 ubiquitin transferase n=1 Tax=Apodospora peruviana TaxID=516989 RepID=A0AAE0HTB5_9PEZI|nr:hypothetical protein B0H66DRAFT_486444 [Apodospora peruviana]
MAASEKKCIICAETRDVDTGFPESVLSSACSHPQTTCLQCIEQYIAAVHKGRNAWMLVECPACTNVLPPIVVQRYADPETRERIEVLAVRQVLEAFENFVWCSSPDCGNGQLHEGGLALPIVRCTSCGDRTCFLHRVAWHTGLSCDEWEIRKRPDALDSDETARKASEETIRRTMKPCPSCKVSIEKNSGW